MPGYICLLRGINVGGNKRIKMADLRALFATIGFPTAQTILASGNVVFQSDETDTRKLVATIEAAIQSDYDFESKILLRTQDELDALIAKNPLYKEEVAGNKLLVTFLREAPSSDAIDTFTESHTTDERVFFIHGEIFIYYPNGAGQSKLSNNVIERKLDVISTARNWNTVLKLQELVHKIAS